MVKKNKSADATSSPPFFEILESMLFGGALAYTFSSLRRVAREEELKSEHLILADRAVIDKKFDRNSAFTGKMEGTVTAEAVSEFMKQNAELLKKIEPTIGNALAIKASKRLEDLKGAFLADFDDEFNQSSLVYGIAVYPEAKRITIIFRGSVMGGDDWTTNANAFKSTIDTPQMLKDLGFDAKKKIKVHRGFKSYLMDNQEPPNDETKIGEIVDNLMEIYNHPKAKDYNLYVTGHSLGGALSTLLAFKLASNKKLAAVLPGPVVNISFASPLVGDRVFNEASQVLEQNKKLIHIRVSNECDVVPCLPPLPGYTHTGVHLHFKEKAENGFELSSGNQKSLFSQWSFDPGSRHSLADYDLRKNASKTDEIGNKTIEDIYYDPAINKGINKVE